LQANEASNRSLSFGHGAHSCPGRKMINKIIDAFFRDLNQYNLDFNLEGMALKRDINLLPTQIKNKNVVTGE
jgi:cytochrome P450